MHFEFCWCIQLKIAFRRIWMLLQRILATAGIGQTDSFPTETWNFFCGRGVYSQFTHNALFTISPSNLLFANNSQAWYFTIRNAISLVTHRPWADGRNSWKIVERWPQMIISSICSCLIGQSIRFCVLWFKCFMKIFFGLLQFYVILCNIKFGAQEQNQGTPLSCRHRQKGGLARMESIDAPPTLHYSCNLCDQIGRCKNSLKMRISQPRINF